MAANQTIILDMITDGIPPRAHVAQYDTSERTLTIQLYNGSEVYTISTGAQVNVSGQKPDGHIFDKQVAYSGNTVTVTLDDQMTAVAGIVNCELTVYSGGVISSKRFILVVEQAAVDLGMMSEDSLAGLQQIEHDAISSAASATESAASALTYRNLVESYAHGDTGSRQEENTDNAMFYKNVSASRAEDSEAYAIGTRSGTAVSSTDPAYQNNSLYYSTIAGAHKDAAAVSETAAKASKDAAKASEDAAKVSENAAKASETASKASETASKASETASKASENAAKSSETNAKASETAAATSESNAATSATAAATSESNAATSATAAATSASNAATSASAAAQSKTDAETAELAAKAARDASATSASNAAMSEINAGNSATAAATSAGNAATSEANAATSATAAGMSEINAENSATAAATSETNAGAYATSASNSATAAANSASAAATSESNAAASETAAAASVSAAGIGASNAAASETAAATSESNAAASATAAAGSAASASGSAEDAEAYSVGTRGGTAVDSTDPAYHNSAKWWAEQASQAAGGGVTSFNGRNGSVSPEAGDYSIGQITAAGTEGQLLGFTANNTLGAVDAPDTGHTIADSTGTEMTKRTNLRFIGASVTDDQTGDATVVDIGAAAVFSVNGSGQLCITYTE